MSSGLIPSASALKFVMMRCRSTGKATARISSAADVIAAVQHGPGLGPQHQVLAGPRPGAPTDVVLNEVGHLVPSRGASAG